jgi:hypothetical protein
LALSQEILSSNTVTVLNLLDAETEELSQYKLLTNMIRETGMAETRFDEILAQLMKLRQGFGEVGEKP